MTRGGWLEVEWWKVGDGQIFVGGWRGRRVDLGRQPGDLIGCLAWFYLLCKVSGNQLKISPDFAPADSATVELEGTSQKVQREGKALVLSGSNTPR